METRKLSVIIAAAGSGLRMGMDTPKVLLPLSGRPALVWSLSFFDRQPMVDRVVVAASAQNLETVLRLAGGYNKVLVTQGGESRTESVKMALEQAGDTSEYIAVHDGARPFLQEADFLRVWEAAQNADGAILATMIKETVKVGQEKGESCDYDIIASTASRRNLWRAQTPQIFRASLIKDLYRHIDCSVQYADDSAVAEAAGLKISLVSGRESNIKLTTPEDYWLAKLIAGQFPWAD